MNLNKLTLALVLSTIAINGAFAEEITLAPATPTMEYQLIAACPTNDCPEIVTPETKRCPKCHSQKDNCKCKQPKQECEPCKKQEAPTCDLEEQSPCKSEVNPCEDKVPTGAACPLPDKDQKAFMMQQYAYPAAVYGTNQVIGEKDAGVYIGESAKGEKIGIPVARDKDNEMTGAAACPCLNNNNEVAIDVEAPVQACETISIQTENSMEATKKTLEPYEISTTTGAAAPLVSAFDDVPTGFWAGCDINKLTENNIIAGYPDRTFKPNLPVSRAEMATMTIKGFNLLNSGSNCPHKTFKDVPRHFWANKMINKAVANGLMEGYTDNLFKPNQPVKRVEAFTILSKGINCGMDECKANEILSQYCDANDIPGWAKIPVAKAIQAGALKDSPKPDMINPNKDASRAEIASMLENIRESLGYSNVDKVSADNCGCTGAAAYIEHEQTITLPTLQLNFNDQINARTANVGDRFAGTTTEEITLNGQTFPCGSIVRGKVLEVNRPTKNCEGSLRLSFETIQYEDCKADLPQQVLTAQVDKAHTPNPVARLVSFPFTWTGGLLGTIGRTVGGAIVSAGNAVENVVGGVGTGTGEVFQGEFKAAGRSYADSAKVLVKAPVDATRTAFSGAMGMFQLSGEEVAYLVDPNGAKISSINPKETVTVAFGCTQK